MSRIDYISIEGLRIDGRRKDELRNTKIFFGSETSVDFLNYDGVSEILQGLNKLEVKGVKNVYGILEEKVDIQCEILLSTDKKVKNSPNERLIKDLAMAVKSTYQEMIISHCYKTSAISIFINIIEYDGSIKSTVLNAVGLALIDAGVSLKDIVSSSTVSYLDSTVLTDPNQMEINASTATLCIAFSSSNNNIIYMDYKSKIALEDFKSLFDSCLAGSRIFTEYVRQRLINYANKAVTLNLKIHSN
ncbi:exosome complex exonuclease rrp41, putative [Theileria annulata]|uniref:Exosome complex exonuclease rrp41, putative n=1 Tax=Theileria annulata TaxID=5874 RepID=Q4UGX4_THEAN|nr:exosome complex exonuclease rrp41, putative [Theileria annulata]CAI73665.1 exosome complex exonuclease rrp41, putative [Theileria annulata]|eukprot:XP_954342.1 exosome complex exonuclease rrp41, putative [Theileria annulata]